VDFVTVAAGLGSGLEKVASLSSEQEVARVAAKKADVGGDLPVRETVGNVAGVGGTT
jgi:hypothetical protein